MTKVTHFVDLQSFKVATAFFFVDDTFASSIANTRHHPFSTRYYPPHSIQTHMINASSHLSHHIPTSYQQINSRVQSHGWTITTRPGPTTPTVTRILTTTPITLASPHLSRWPFLKLLGPINVTMDTISNRSNPLHLSPHQEERVDSEWFFISLWHGAVRETKRLGPPHYSHTTRHQLQTNYQHPTPATNFCSSLVHLFLFCLVNNHSLHSNTTFASLLVHR